MPRPATAGWPRSRPRTPRGCTRSGRSPPASWRGHEGQPLVVKNTMYVVTPWPERALRVRPHAGRLSAELEVPAGREPERDRDRPAATRSTAARSTPTARSSTTCSTATPSRSTPRPGKELWKTQIATSARARPRRWRPSSSRIASSSAPRAASSASTAGSRGSISRPARSSGPRRNIGPDAEMLVKPGTFKPFYDKGTDLGQSSWPKDAWKTGGAPVWGWMSYDPELDLVYYGVGQPVALQRRAAAGRQQVDRSVLARRPSDGVAGLGLPVHAARQLGLRRRRDHDPGGRQDRRPGRARRWSRSTRTASSTRWTAPPARCSPPRPTSR